MREPAAAGERDLSNCAAEKGQSMTRWKLLAYGGMALPYSVAELPIILYLPAFYAKELQLKAGLVGAVFLLARLWDGFADLLSGWLSDRSMSRFGRRKPWVLLTTPLVMVSLWFLCNPPSGAGLGYLAIWAALFYTAWTAGYIPYVSWGTELACDYSERSRVTAFREAFKIVGNLFFAAAPLLLLPAGAPLQAVLFLIAMSVLVLAPLMVLPVTIAVPDLPPTKRIETHLFEGLRDLAKDRVLIRFIIVTLSMLIANGVCNSLAVFSFSTGLQLPDKVFAIILIMYISALSALPVMLYWGKRAEKHRLLAGALVLQAVGFAFLVWAPMANFPLVAAAWVMIGIGQAAFVSLPTSILADIIDNGDVAMGQRRAGAYVAIYNLLFKIGLALGVGLSFGLLELVQFDPSAAQHTPDDARNIRMLAFGLPCLLLMPAVLLLLGHPITRQVQGELRERIRNRDASHEATVCR